MLLLDPRHRRSSTPSVSHAIKEHRHTPIRITLAALALCASTLAQASEVIEFPIPASSTLTRAEMLAEARQHHATGSMNIDFAGPRVMAPVSTKTRDEVRMEVAASRNLPDNRLAAGYFVGGM